MKIEGLTVKVPLGPWPENKSTLTVIVEADFPTLEERDFEKLVQNAVSRVSRHLSAAIAEELYDREAWAEAYKQWLLSPERMVGELPPVIEDFRKEVDQ